MHIMFNVLKMYNVLTSAEKFTVKEEIKYSLKTNDMTSLEHWMAGLNIHLCTCMSKRYIFLDYKNDKILKPDFTNINIIYY